MRVRIPAAAGCVTAVGLVVAGSHLAAGQTATCAGMFPAKVQPILDMNCVVCHQNAEPLGNLSLEAGAALKNTVGVASDELASMPRVTPGDAAKSYLLHKLDGTHEKVGGSGDRMPLGADPLSAADIATIQTWIVNCKAAG
jgi:hypothetical protein